MSITSKYVEGQDYQIAEQLIEVLHKKNCSDLEKLFFEGIFLDLSDRTQSHPIMPFEFADNVLLKTLLRPTKIRKIKWEVPNGFNFEAYINSYWFHSSIRDSEYESKLHELKKNYLEGKIDIFTFYSARHNTYNDLRIGDHEEYFDNVRDSTYLDKLKKILHKKL